MFPVAVKDRILRIGVFFLTFSISCHVRESVFQLLLRLQKLCKYDCAYHDHVDATRFSKT